MGIYIHGVKKPESCVWCDAMGVSDIVSLECNRSMDTCPILGVPDEIYETARESLAFDGDFSDPKPEIYIPIYDQEDIHHGCTVQVLTSSVTGESSVGWWKEEE